MLLSGYYLSQGDNVKNTITNLLKIILLLKYLNKMLDVVILNSTAVKLMSIKIYSPETDTS